MFILVLFQMKTMIITTNIVVWTGIDSSRETIIICQDNRYLVIQQTHINCSIITLLPLLLMLFLIIDLTVCQLIMVHHNCFPETLFQLILLPLLLMVSHCIKKFKKNSTTHTFHRLPLNKVHS